MWNSGSGSQKRSSAVIRNFVRCTLAPWRTSASWLSRQPLGLAVVPDVYISTATSRIAHARLQRSDLVLADALRRSIERRTR